MSSISEFRVPGSEFGKTGERINTPGKPRGFTLLEVLIAVAIMAGIVTVIYMSFFTASRNVEQAEARRDATDLARTLLTKLSNEIANAYYSRSMTETFFYGKKSSAEPDAPRFDNIAFTTLANNVQDEAELREVGYSFEEASEKNTRMLIRKEKRDLSTSTPPLEGGEDSTLTDRIKSLRLRYFNGSTWTEDWDNRTQRSLQPPNAVEITLVLDGGFLYSMQVEVGR
jgi:type II secretion system protein J